MAGGLAALLDDIALIARAASAAAPKAVSSAVGVVVDDAAVTPQYVQGIEPARELPIIGKIALGSIMNKLVIIMPLVLLLSEFAPQLLTPLLMVGALYLCFEGAEKIHEALIGHHESITGEEDHTRDAPVIGNSAGEKALVRGAITTDLILSAEIMVIALSSVDELSLPVRAVSLLFVAFLITALVYGTVAFIVKMDDMGLALSRRPDRMSRSVGLGLVRGMPILLNVLSVVGMAAMLWVGGHILLVGADELGWHAPYELVHSLSVPAEHVHPILGWLVETLGSAVAGAIVGALLVLVLHVPKLLRRGGADAHH